MSCLVNFYFFLGYHFNGSHIYCVFMYVILLSNCFTSWSLMRRLHHACQLVFPPAYSGGAISSDLTCKEPEFFLPRLPGKIFLGFSIPAIHRCNMLKHSLQRRVVENQLVFERSLVLRCFLGS